MVDDDEESGGYAIGRRIYEKQEIDVRYSTCLWLKWCNTSYLIMIFQPIL